MTQRRWIAVGTVLAAAGLGVALLWVGRAESPILDDTLSPQQEPEVAPRNDIGIGVEVSREPESEAAASAAAFGTRSASTETGRGRIFGRVEAPGSAALPASTVVALHRIDMEAEVVEYDATLVDTAEPDSEGRFDFSALPLGQYSVFATAPGYTIQSSPLLTAERRERELVLRLVAGGAITGRVVNEARQPIEGAHVFAAAWDIAGQRRNGTRDRVLSSQVQSAADGSFAVDNLRMSINGEPGYKLAVKAEGYATFLSDYIQAGTQGVEFVLTDGGVVVGRLTHFRSGEPVPDKIVSVQSELAMERLVARSDIEGWFFLNNVAAGEHRLELIDDELVILPETASFRVAEAGSTDDLAVQVGPGGRLSGRVFDADSGRGVAGATITPRVEQDRKAPKPVTTNANGEYQFKGLRPGNYGLELGKVEGYGYSQREEERTRMSSAAIGSETTGIDFSLTRGIVITGVVVDESGQPVSQASVNARADRTDIYDYSRTDDRGAFTVAGFQPNQLVIVDAGKAGYALLDAEPEGGNVQLKDGDYSGVRLIMGTPASISGTVVDKLNRPKPGVQMYARSPTQINGGSPIERSAADGSIAFEQLNPGIYKLFFSDLPWEFAQKYAQEVTVAKGEHVRGVKIVYPEAEGLTISGRVTNTEGRPISGASIRMTGPSYQDVDTDANGEYTLIGLSEGPHTFFAASYQHSMSEQVTAQAGARNVNFILKGLVTVEGRVVGRATGKPVPAFRARAKTEQPVRFFVREDWIDVRDDQGRFRLTGIEGGDITIEVWPEGFAETIHALGKVDGGETLKDVVIRVDTGATLTGRVLDATGGGVSGAQLFVGDMPQDEWERDREKRTMTSADGSYELGALPAGTVTVQVFHPSYVPASRQTFVSPGAVNREDIVMSNGGTITGRVTVSGKPASGQNFSYSFGQQHERVQTTAGGEYRIGGLPDGMVNLNPYVLTPDGAFRGKTAQVTVTDGTITEMDFDFVEGTSTVEGTVYSALGTPVGANVRIRIEILDPSGATDYFHTQTDASGRYMIGFVPAGQASLTASIPGDTEKNLTLSVGEGQRIQQDVHL